jgi:hypothetical protein
LIEVIVVVVSGSEIGRAVRMKFCGRSRSIQLVRPTVVAAAACSDASTTSRQLKLSLALPGTNVGPDAVSEVHTISPSIEMALNLSRKLQLFPDIRFQR